jgi:hypothetical protein
LVKLEDDLTRLGTHADTFLESCRRGAPVSEVLAQIVTMLAAGMKTIDTLRDSPPQAIVKLDVDPSHAKRFRLVPSHDAPVQWSAPDDISSLLMVEPSDDQVVTREVDAIFEIADHSQGQLLAGVATRDGISEHLASILTETEWDALKTTFREHPAMLSEFAATLIRNFRATHHA